MTVDVSSHAALRYVQRIEGIVDERESKQYLAQNSEHVTDHVLSMFEHSAFLWTGCVNSKDINHFYIAQDVILLLEESKSKIVTLYRCDYGFPSVVTRQTIKGLLHELGKLRDRRQKRGSHIGDDRAKLEVEIENIDAQIDAKKAELDALRNKRDTVQAELDEVNSSIMVLDAQIDSVALSIINSIHLRKDITGKAI